MSIRGCICGMKGHFHGIKGNCIIRFIIKWIVLKIVGFILRMVIIQQNNSKSVIKHKNSNLLLIRFLFIFSKSVTILVSDIVALLPFLLQYLILE